MLGLVILNGVLRDADFLKNISADADYIVCADGGLDHALKSGIFPDLVVGDMDSLETKTHKFNQKIYPQNKDLTDGEIAIKECLEKGCTKIILTCALGKRKDHELSNIFLLSKYNMCTISEKDTEISVASEDVILNSLKGKTVSIIPLEKTLLSLSGFLYPLEKKEINLGETLTMSNVVKDDNAKISITSGKIILVVNKL